MIKEMCYELYKLDWKDSHNITSKIELEYIKDYYMSTGFNEDDDCDMNYTYNDYLDEFGYNGELYANYNCFLDNEYFNSEYIIKLLNNKSLIIEYYKDIQKMCNIEYTLVYTNEKGDTIARDYFRNINEALKLMGDLIQTYKEYDENKGLILYDSQNTVIDYYEPLNK